MSHVRLGVGVEGWGGRGAEDGDATSSQFSGAGACLPLAAEASIRAAEPLAFRVRGVARTLASAACLVCSRSDGRARYLSLSHTHTRPFPPFTDFGPNVKARMWPRLSDMFHIRSTAARPLPRSDMSLAGLIWTSVHDKSSGSMKITTHLDNIGKLLHTWIISVIVKQHLA